jgi:CRP/FNR family transcriptional regulator, anaerobic regulatory protein
MERLLTMLSAIEPLSVAFQDALKKRSVILSWPKGHMLLNASKTSDTAYFVGSGFAMTYRYIEGKKHIEEFYPEGKIVISPSSFFQQVPSKESIELLQQSEVIHISYDSVMWLLQNFPEAQVIYRVTMNVYYENSRERIHDFQLLNAVERYEKLNELYPSVKHLVPLEQIATYLGIAPQHLSRIRREADD